MACILGLSMSNSLFLPVWKILETYNFKKAPHQQNFWPGICFMIIIIANLFSFIEQRSRIRALSNTVGDLAEGRKNLKDSLILYSADELGLVADKINHFISYLDILISNTSENASSLSANAHSFKESSSNMEDTTRCMSHSLEQVGRAVEQGMSLKSQGLLNKSLMKMRIAHRSYQRTFLYF